MFHKFLLFPHFLKLKENIFIGKTNKLLDERVSVGLLINNKREFEISKKSAKAIYLSILSYFEVENN